MSEAQTNAMLSQTMLDAQQGVLGSMLIDPDTVGPVLSKVQASDFTIKQYRTIFQTIQEQIENAYGLPAKQDIKNLVGLDGDMLKIRP